MDINTRNKRFTCSSTLSPRGDFTEIVNTDLAIDALFNLLTIREGTYIRKPYLGCKFHRFIQEPATDENIEAIIEEIYTKAETYLSIFLTIENVQVKTFNNNTGYLFNITTRVDETIRRVEIGISDTSVYYKSLLEY